MNTHAAKHTTDYLSRPDNRRLAQFPGAYGLPYLGYVFDLLNNPFSCIDRHYRRYGPVCRTRLTALLSDGFFSASISPTIKVASA